jgi:hypothetical protein
MWEQMRTTWDQSGLVEYGIFQRDRKPGAPIWRRHIRRGKSRFGSVRNSLFADKGARKACKGNASYPKERYAANDNLLVPYVATWLNGNEYAYLVRASAGDPEITLVPVTSIEGLDISSEQTLTEQLASIFAQGGETHGVYLLGGGDIRHQ